MSTLKVLIGIVVLIVLGGAWYALRPERLFINQKVSEQFPVASASSGPKELFSGQFHSVAHETKHCDSLRAGGQENTSLHKLRNFERPGRSRLPDCCRRRKRQRDRQEGGLASHRAIKGKHRRSELRASRRRGFQQVPGSNNLVPAFQRQLWHGSADTEPDDDGREQTSRAC